ncbi:alpha/beta hydrolase [Actinomycetospora sp. NBRC 106375]|uniref:alpha/beta hydrolase family protein n=1 Tax=Actinomycetospora sp. NBRC 106375 TaxID=3032207 RepID=UPI0024A29DBE|nr:alpha/beta fold hydrolase [Actinomycetospora sp. NBRC 106375]GLZ49794.1 alpha/beta hydrolase [Actinomycetospora sp. NBRC 106375]
MPPTVLTPTPAPTPPTTLTGLAFQDAEFDGQFLRALDTIPSGGADVGESFMTARRIAPGDHDGWLREWQALGDRVLAAADASAAAGRRVSAYEGYLRAMTYHRTSGIFLYRPPLDPEFVDAHRRQRDAFARAAARSPWRIEPVEIPYGTTPLAAWWVRPDGDGPHPTVAMVGGYDGTKEESFVAGGVAALRRGYAVLLVDGPGQGAALTEQGLVFRPDWEAVVTPQVDWLLARPEVDRQRIVLMGRSWGGYLAPRAATVEHRIAALVADAPQYDPGAGARYLLPEQYRDRFDTGDPDELNAVLRQEMAASPAVAFILDRGMLTHGFATPIDYLRGSADYTLEGLAPRITCPTLLCTGENDVRGNAAQPLFDALTVPKECLRFTNADGAGEHDEAGAAALWSQRVFDWLDATLQR